MKDSIFDLIAAENPYPYFAEFRRDRPVFWDSESGYWILSRYQDVKDVLDNEAHYSAEADRINYSTLCREAQAILDPINFIELYGLSTTENPQHDRVKKIVVPEFVSFFHTGLDSIVENMVAKSVATLPLAGDCDLLKELLYELPAEVILKILGIPPEMVSIAKTWCNSRLLLTWGPEEEQVAHAENIVSYWKFCGDLLRQRQEKPEDDLPSRLLRHVGKDGVTFHDILLLCYGLVFSGHTTTSMFLAEAIRLLLVSGTWGRIATAEISSWKTIDEVLRLCPSAFTRRRKVLSEDVVVSGIKIPKGATVLLLIASANRDDAVFSNPNKIDFERGTSTKHLTFGHGFHYCIGSRLVRKEYGTIIDALTKRYPNLSVIAEKRPEYVRNISIRAPKALWARFK